MDVLYIGRVCDRSWMRPVMGASMTASMSAFMNAFIDAIVNAIVGPSTNASMTGLVYDRPRTRTGHAHGRSPWMWL